MPKRRQPLAFPGQLFQQQVVFPLQQSQQSGS